MVLAAEDMWASARGYLVNPSTDKSAVGITQAIDSYQWPGPTEFIYRGSLGPIQVAPNVHMALEQLGQRVAGALPDYRGYLQADLIEDAAQNVWLLELNPRWTAGMEVLHEAARTAAQSPLAAHLRAWEIQSPPRDHWPKPITNFVSKAIYYAPSDLQLDQATRRSLYSLRAWQPTHLANVQWSLADLPNVTEPTPVRFNMGEPILTVRCRIR